MLQAVRGQEITPIPDNLILPDDVRLLHAVLLQCQSMPRTTADRNIPTVFNLHKCGTAMRFLTAFFAQQEGCSVLLEGDTRMSQRPIGQLVDALRQLGADIQYVRQEGYPPVLIHGRNLNKVPVIINRPVSSQFVSALLLIGVEVQTDNHSPYIAMTRAVCQEATASWDFHTIERDWSAAAFWYERTALFGGSLFLQGLQKESLQGDCIVADVFSALGVRTTYLPDGVLLEAIADRQTIAGTNLTMDFSVCPDLYPAVFATCHQLGVQMNFSGQESLPLKESNRLQAMQQLTENPSAPMFRSYADHRIAMALLAAGLQVDDTDCICKSYPLFTQQLAALSTASIAQ